MQKRFCKITLSILALAAATVFAVFYYCLYTSPVFQYRGAYYQTQVTGDETRYAASDGTISVMQTDSGSTVTITYEWNAPQTFLIEQNGQAITVADRKGIVLLQGIWQNGALLNTSGGVNETYASQKSAWLDNQHASVQRPVPPNAAEALDIAMGANIVQRGKGLAPKWVPLSLLLVLLLVGAERSKAQSGRRWGEICKRKLHNPAWQAALQVDETGEPTRDVVFSKPWLVGGLYILFLMLLLAYDVS